MKIPPLDAHNNNVTLNDDEENAEKAPFSSTSSYSLLSHTNENIYEIIFVWRTRILSDL